MTDFIASNPKIQLNVKAFDDSNIVVDIYEINATGSISFRGSVNSDLDNLFDSLESEIDSLIPLAT